MRFFIYVLTLFLFSSSHGLAQVTNDGNVLLININYAAEFPAGDLANRFGNNFEVGGGLEWITKKHNIILGLESGIIFGSDIKEDPLVNLRTPDGFVIGNDRDFADIKLRERGFYVGGLVGKIFSLSSHNPRSGIRLTLGTGLLQHKIRLQEDPERAVTALSGDYKKGYDKLTNGLAFNEFIGYQLLSKNRRLNFYIGMEFTQAFTQNRRSYDFDTMSKDDFKRKDFLYGLKIGWTLPIYLVSNPDEIFY